jgi:hypothetical protein
MRKFAISLLILFCFSVIAQAKLPLDKLALYMSFDKISNDKVLDESENKNDGKIIKAKVAKGKGKYGDAMEFNGKDSFIDIKNSKSLSIPDQVSISAWVNWKNAGDGWLAVLANGKQGGPWENYGLFVNRGGTYFYFTLSLGGEGEHVTQKTAGGDTKDGEWTHCVCTYDGKSAKIYVNGKLKLDQARGAKLIGGKQPLRIGHRNGSGHWYNGLIDEVAVFSVALDDKQAVEVGEDLQVALATQPGGKLPTVWADLKNR